MKKIGEFLFGEFAVTAADGLSFVFYFGFLFSNAYVDQKTEEKTKRKQFGFQNYWNSLVLFFFLCVKPNLKCVSIVLFFIQFIDTGANQINIKRARND